MACRAALLRPVVPGTPKSRSATSSQRAVCTNAEYTKRDFIASTAIAAGLALSTAPPAEAGAFWQYYRPEAIELPGMPDIGTTSAARWDGPAKFLKSRQQANSAKLIAPIEVSLRRLLDTQQTLENGGTDYTAAIKTVRAASCNCYSFEAFSSDSLDTKVSLITQNLNLADPCTFRIVVKNTTLLMDDTDPLKKDTRETLDMLIRSYQQLDDVLLSAGDVDSETKDKVKPTLDRTIALQTQLRDKVGRCIAQAA